MSAPFSGLPGGNASGAASRTHTYLPPEDYTVGWICALPLEMAAARGMLDETHPSLNISGDTNTYEFGRIGHHNVVIACLPLDGYGTNNAANVASHMTRTFRFLRVRLMVGIGGGVPRDDNDIRLGDVVVGQRIMQYDLGKIVQGGTFQRTSTVYKVDPAISTALSKLKATHESELSLIPDIIQQMLQTRQGMAEYAFPTDTPDRLFLAEYEHFSAASSCDECDSSKLVQRRVRSIPPTVIHYGAIASGNAVIKDSVTRDALAEELDIICFEMEAAGLFGHFPCLVVRGICDYADSHKNKRWQRYAAATAAAYAKELLWLVGKTEPSQVQHPVTGSYGSVSSMSCNHYVSLLKYMLIFYNN